MMDLYLNTNMKLLIINRLFKLPVSYITFSISVLFLGGLFLLSSCDENSTLIGENLQPQNDKFSVNYYDEFLVEVYTGSLDSLRADETSLAVAGELIDPVFGTTCADFISQVRLSDELVFSEYPPVIDSLIVFLEVAGSYGDTNSIMEINVHELKKDVYLDSAYYSNFSQEDLFYENIVGSANYDAYDTIIQIHMDKTFAEKILDDTNALVSQDDFIQKFKGLYFTSDIQSGRGVLTNFNLLSFTSEMVLFFHYPLSDTLYYSFSISESSARINMYSHDFSTAYPAYGITHLNDNIEDSVSYVQGLAGVFTRFSFPALENWRDSLPIAINKAELVVNLSTDDPYSSEFTPPDYLDIRIRDDDGNFKTVYDLVLGREYFGGHLTDGVYTFNISDFVHKYLTGYYNDPTLYIFVNADYYQADRAVLNGYNHSGRVELKMTYTK
ncbi:MAG: DUF4270 family protein [Bacteroidetes bacterium]|nr:DUF4270 family protein [Bacteroidota bacterium]